jgi:hypothetical protein
MIGMVTQLLYGRLGLSVLRPPKTSCLVVKIVSIPPWWSMGSAESSSNYVLSAAWTCGYALCAIVIFFCKLRRTPRVSFDFA